MRTPRLLTALAVLAVFTAGCGGTLDAGSGSSDDGAPPAAGACLEGATDCEDTGGDMGAPPPDGERPVSDGDAPVSHEPDPDAPATPRATEVEPTSGLEDVHAVGWDGVEVDPDDQSRVTVRWTSGVAPCHAFAGVDVEYGAEAVTLTVLEGSVPSDEDQACIELAQLKQAVVELDEELGPRSILDGAE